MMKIVRSAFAPWALAGALSCGGARASPPSVTAGLPCDGVSAGSTPVTAPAREVTRSASDAATSGPWSEGMTETAPNRFLQAKGIRFAYRAFGRKASVPVVFLAPLGRNMDFWDPTLTDALAEGHLIVLFDNAGVGLSSGTSPKTIAETAKDAAAFIDGLRELHMTDSDWVNGRIDVVGLSFGGLVAQQLALDEPDLVQRVVLAGTAPRGGQGVGTWHSPEVGKRETADDVLHFFFTQSKASKAAGRAFIARIDGRQKDRDAPVATTTIAAQAAAVNAWGSSATGGYSYLAALTQPVLVADGVADPAFRANNSLVLTQALPNAQLIVYPDSAQGFLFQYPERFAEHISTFLRRP